MKTGKKYYDFLKFERTMYQEKNINKTLQSDLHNMSYRCLNSQFYMVEETKATAQNHQPATNSSQTL
jgi:hypothetical protein